MPSMGLLNTLRLVEAIDKPATPNPRIEAQLSPPVMETVTSSLFQPNLFITRDDAMAVPSVARARNLICGVISSLPLALYRKSTGQELGSPLWLEQFDPRQPRAVTLSYIVDSLFFFGSAYLEVTSTYADDGRPASFAFVSNDRVTPTFNANQTLVTSYAVDGTKRPNDGVGSLITFQGVDSEGILARGGRTIKAALDLEKAAAVAASTPMPTGYIKNNGADLPADQITGLLAQWKAARAQRSTAYLSSTLSYETTSFSPKEMAYNEASQFLSTQIARLCNVPAYLLSSEMNNSMTYSNILDERRQFVSMTLQPFISAIEGRLSMNDITAIGNVVKFEIDETFLRADALTRLAVIEKMLALNLITLEQAMQMEDLSPNGNS